MVLLALLVALPALLVLAGVALGVASVYVRLSRKSRVVGFFHPYCDAGGGGERVLFCGIKHVLERHPDWKAVVFTGDLASKDDILRRCRERFGVGSTPDEKDWRRIEFIRLSMRFLLDASFWSRVTLLGQSLGSMVVALEACWLYPCEVFIDSMGYAFALPVARIVAGSRVACYIHYPTISSDMLQRVQERRPSYNNAADIANSATVSSIKVTYYKIFAWLYGRAGGWFSSVTMVNSSWTKRHIDDLWNISSLLVFPPCLPKVEATKALALGASLETKQHARSSIKQRGSSKGKRVARQETDEDVDLGDDFREDNLIVSVGQFRPEKDHRLQLASIAQYNKAARTKTKVRLVMVGSCRNAEDSARVEELRKFATQELGLLEGEDFEFALGVSKAELDLYLERALIGIHTMWNEHFGIGIVEMMQRGCIVIAHNSGGPKLDIVRDGENGFLASTVEDYANTISKIVGGLNHGDRSMLRAAALRSVARFTEEEFAENLLSALKPLFAH